MIEAPSASEAKIEFFKFFSRFEFALKDLGFLQNKTEGSNAWANWDCFAKEPDLNNIFIELSGDPDIQCLINEPPLKQIVKEKHVDWKIETISPIRDIESLLKAVKTVRNNLFHGGKAGENVRDDVLCRAGTKILRECLERHGGMRARFMGEF